MIAAGIHRTYKHLPEDRKAAFFSRRYLRRSALLSLVAATIVSCIYWFGSWMPLDLPAGVTPVLARAMSKFDFIPALFAALLPAGWQSGFHQFFRGGVTYCFPGPFWWETMRYLRAAIPGYWIAFIMAALAFRFVRFAIANTLQR